MTHPTMLVVALIGQLFGGGNCPGGQCPSPATQVNPFPQGRYFVSPQVAPAQLSPDGYRIVQGSIRIGPVTQIGGPASVRRTLVAQPPPGAVVRERIPTAAPGPRYDTPAGAPPRPVEASPPPRTSEPASAKPEASTGQPGPPGDTVMVPVPAREEYGYVVKIPREFPEPTRGLPRPDAPSAVRTDNGETLKNYQVTGMLWRPGQGGPARQGIQPSPHAESHRFVEDLATGAPLPEMADDTGKFRVTVISHEPGDRRQAVQDLRMGNGELAPWKGQLLVRSGSPGDWIIKDIGLDRIEGAANGKPGVVIQDPSGKVVYALAQYSQPAAAEALRKVNPSFDPNKVPGTSSGRCPIGFNRTHWPLILGGAVCVIALFAIPRRSTNPT